MTSRAKSSSRLKRRLEVEDRSWRRAGRSGASANCGGRGAQIYEIEVSARTFQPGRLILETKGRGNAKTHLYTIRHRRHTTQHLPGRNNIPQPMSRDLIALAKTTNGNNMTPPILPLKQPMRASRRPEVLVSLDGGTDEIPIRFIHEQHHPSFPCEICKLRNQSRGIGRPCWVVGRDEDDRFHVVSLG